MARYFHGVGADETTGSTVVVDALARIEARQERDHRDRTFATMMAVMGLVFAAARLGVIALPRLRK